MSQKFAECARSTESVITNRKPEDVASKDSLIETDRHRKEKWWTRRGSNP